MATCENCGLPSNTGMAKMDGCNVACTSPMALGFRLDCERRAKERALAEVARLQARIAAAKAECAPGRTYPCLECGDAAADELCSNVLDALNAKEASNG